MASIPSPIRKWIQQWVTGVGSGEVASQAPVQSVDGETGEVTISVPVEQVNGQTGDVTLTASDVNALADTYSAPVQSVNGNTGDVTINVPVDSVNGETGTVTLSASDVNALADTYTAPVQSVNSQTGDVTVSAGGVIPSSQTVASYADLPTTDRSEAEIWFVTGENDIVASTQLSPVVWRSVSDFTIVTRAIPDSVVTRDDDNNTFTTDTRRGVVFNSTESWPQIGFKISQNPSGYSTAYIGTLSNESVIESKDVSGFSSGDTFTFNVSISPSTDYYIALDNNGATYTVGENSNSVNTPITSDDGVLTIEGRYNEGVTSPESNKVANILSIGNVGI